ncbi:MAG: hypothetical protein IJV58_09795 [Oscillospiraceae bacterium]|nr:hypothetical protein [Oscillospiraceae bacterium]MBR1459595.1 hypothetical protein [Oscillospiraceae bacterium]
MNERILAESEQYRIEAEYESVLLTVKESGRTVCIGDFYGDPAGALLDADGRFAVLYGCGVIVYFLHHPYAPYQYDTLHPQWFERYRMDPMRRITGAEQTDAHTVCLLFETGETETLHIP